jgi:hypothetical protein
MRKSKRTGRLFGLALFQILILGSLISMNAQENPNLNCPPRITMGSLLDNLKVDSTGRVSFGRLYAVCLPEPARQGKTIYAYHPYDGGKLAAALKNSGGEKLNTFVFYGEKFTTLWELPSYEVVGGRESVKPLAPGSYELEFSAEDKPFMRLPFTVSTLESRDVYRPQKFYLLDGAWRNYAEIYYPNVNRFMQMRVWLRDTENAGLEPKTVQYAIELVREADKKTLARVGGERSGMRLTHDWQAFNLSFRAAEGSEFTPAEVLKTEGRYRINLSVDGKPYGVYFFAVRGGKFQFVAGGDDNPLAFAFPLEAGDKGFSLWRNKP